MRIFHFVNASFGIDELFSGGKGIKSGGGWTAALIQRMLSETDHDFAYAGFGESKGIQHIQRNRIDYFVIPKRFGDGSRRLKKGLEVCRGLVESWNPDLIHIHGTENPFGLLTARAMVKCPAIISIQGLLGPCSEWYRYFGNRSLTEILRMHWWVEFPLMRGPWFGYHHIRKNAEREQEIIAGNKCFMGRTSWDRAYVHALAPTAVYYHEGRLIREPFWQEKWAIEKVVRHRLIFTNAKHPRKGTEVLLEAVKLLKSEYPDIQVRLAGGIPRRTGYGRYLRRKMREIGESVVELGPLNAAQMVDELLKAHIFVHPSFIDNSPNSVAEAQLLGMPVIATYTGGVPSLIDDGRTGLFFPTGDAFMLAARLHQVFESDELAVALGRQAHEVAIRRHDPYAITRDIIGIYEDVLRESKARCSG